MTRVAVIGYGYWGPNLARNIVEAAGAHLAVVCDIRDERCELARTRHPGATVTTDWRAAIEARDVDAVAVATPLSTHHAIAAAALAAGKHVLVEKPLAESANDALDLIARAKGAGRVLMVDHTFAYHGAVRAIRDLIAAGELGTVYYYDSVRVNLGLFHSDANVLWDLAVHDLSILAEVLPERPVAVSALGKSHFEGRPENIAYLTLFFAGTAIAHLHVNWLAPVKVRRTLIGGSRRMIVYDDLEPSEKVKVYDSGVTVSDDPESRYRARYDYRIGGMTAPQFDTAEPLRRMTEHFLECVRTGDAPRTDGRAGLAVIRVLEAAKTSMDEGGRPVALSGGDD